MNCKPGQRAWICVPKTPVNEAMGVTQLHGHVVQTVRLVPGLPGSAPTWEVTPPQRCKVVGPVPAKVQGILPIGKEITANGIPDAYLRPIEDFPPEELQQLQRELAS